MGGVSSQLSYAMEGGGRVRWGDSYYLCTNDVYMLWDLT
jgi:hypothetical protein